MQSLYTTGFANQPISERVDDGLVLKGCYMTAAVKCVPPKHMPTRQETLNCLLYFQREMSFLKNLKATLALGKFAFEASLLNLKSQGIDTQGMRFMHGAQYPVNGFPTIYCSYHPSPQNTNTGKLTREMFESLLQEIRVANNQ